MSKVNIPHKWASILIAIAEGKQIMMRYPPGEWFAVNDGNALGHIAANTGGFDLKVAPKMVSLVPTSHVFPEPVSTTLEHGQEYWTPNVSTFWVWTGDSTDYKNLEQRLIQLTEAGANAQWDAMVAACVGNV